MERDPQHKISCGHGFKRELPAYRGIRIFEMNCGEVRCSLSSLDYFQPNYIREWIDAAFNGQVDGWHELDRKVLVAARAGK